MRVSARRHPAKIAARERNPSQRHTSRNTTPTALQHELASPSVLLQLFPFEECRRGAYLEARVAALAAIQVAEQQQERNGGSAATGHQPGIADDDIDQCL